MLELHGEPLRRCVRALKARGVKTEPAFARCLGLAGDPYLALLGLGRATDAELARLRFRPERGAKQAGLSGRGSAASDRGRRPAAL